MASVPAPLNTNEDLGLVRLAREIAINHFPIETILKTYQITDETWNSIQANPRFQQLLKGAIEDWNGALNTHERAKLKAASMLEEWLPEGNMRLNDRTETLSSKVELLKLLAKIAGMGVSDASVAGVGEKFSVTINLGADNNLKFEKEITATKTIEAVDAEVVGGGG